MKVKIVTLLNDMTLVLRLSDYKADSVAIYRLADSSLVQLCHVTTRDKLARSIGLRQRLSCF